MVDEPKEDGAEIEGVAVVATPEISPTEELPPWGARLAAKTDALADRLSSFQAWMEEKFRSLTLPNSTTEAVQNTTMTTETVAMEPEVPSTPVTEENPTSTEISTEATEKSPMEAGDNVEPTAKEPKPARRASGKYRLI